jgi:hypothetical protein
MLWFGHGKVPVLFGPWLSGVLNSKTKPPKSVVLVQVISNQEMLEYYLPAFHATVKSGQVRACLWMLGRCVMGWWVVV